MIWAAFGLKTGSAHPEATWRSIAAEPVATSRLAAWAHQHRLLPSRTSTARLRHGPVGAAQRLPERALRHGGLAALLPLHVPGQTPLPAFIVLALALTAAACGLGSRPPDRIWRRAYELAPLLCFVLVYGGVAVTTHLNIGHRHLLPLYPALYILAGAAALAPAPRIWAARWILPGSLALGGAVALVAWPNYLAYFNLVAGGPRHGYRRLVDSSLDWGQDLRGLKNWLAGSGLERPGAPRVYLSYLRHGQRAVLRHRGDAAAELLRAGRVGGSAPSHGRRLLHQRAESWPSTDGPIGSVSNRARTPVPGGSGSRLRPCWHTAQAHHRQPTSGRGRGPPGVPSRPAREAVRQPPPAGARPPGRPLDPRLSPDPGRGGRGAWRG